MNAELKVALRYFFFPKKDTPKVIPRAGTLGLALSITILLTTLSVMNGFDIHIKEKVMSRMPHIYSSTIENKELKKLSHEYSSQIDKVGTFYQTKLLVPKWNYLQVHVFISDDFDVPMISSALASQYSWSPQEEIELWGFSHKKIFGKSYPHNYKVLIEGERVDSIYAIYLPSYFAQKFKALSLQNITGFWLKDPFDAQKMKLEFKNKASNDIFYSWVDQYVSLFEALSAEKRLVGVVLSLLIILIFFQLNLTMILIFKDKQKDMVALFCFLNGRKSIFRVFFSYALINIVFGVIFGALLGWMVSNYLPMAVSFIEQLFNFEILPYGQYAFDTLPSLFLISDLIYVSIFSLITGVICSYFLIKKLSSASILKTLRQYQ